MKNFPGFRPYRNVIVCSMVPGAESESVVGGVFGHYDPITRPQDLGVVGRYILAHDDLYLHILERKADPAVSGQRRGLPAFEKIAEVIAPYVTPYPHYWTNPSDSVAKLFYSYEPADADLSDTELTVLVQRMERGSEEAIAKVFADSDADDLPQQLGVVGRWLYAIDDVFVHLLEQDRRTAAASRSNHDHRPAFGAIMKALSPYVHPYNPQTWTSYRDAQAQVFYQWEAPDWGSPPPAPKDGEAEQSWGGEKRPAPSAATNSAAPSADRAPTQGGSTSWSGPWVPGSGGPGSEGPGHAAPPQVLQHAEPEQAEPEQTESEHAEKDRRTTSPV